MKSNLEIKKPNYTRRRVAATGLAVLALFGAKDIYDKGKDYVANVQHDNKQYRDFTNPDIGKLLDEKGYTEDEVVTITIPVNGLNPTHMANILGAKNTIIVRDEITAQVGGQFSMNPGEKIVLPKDQFDIPLVQPK